MQKRFPKLVGVTMLMLLMLSFLVSSPARAQCVLKPGAGECIAPPYSVPAEPVWATLNAATSNNYPGGNESFDVFVINSDVPPNGNVTLYNETITSTALPPSFNASTAKGLPLQLSPGQAITSTIALPIPSDFNRSSFTANLVVNVAYWNGTTDIHVKLTGSTLVYVLGAPLVGTSTTTSQTSQTTMQSGTVSTGLFAAGVAIPSLIAVILIVLLVRRNAGPKVGK